MARRRKFDELYDAEVRADPYLDEYVRARDLMATDRIQAIKDMEALAHRGSVLSMFFVADAVRDGYIYERDLSCAERWYEAAAAAGWARGLTGLALTHLLMGRTEEAVKELEAAIEDNYPPAMNTLAGIYFRGDGGFTDKSKALALWKRGASLGHFHAKRHLIDQSLHGKFGFWRRLMAVPQIASLIADHISIHGTNPYTDRLR
jgi:TPR repeat protein